LTFQDVVQDAFGLWPTADAELRVASGGYEAIRTAADLVIPERADLAVIDLPRVGYAFRHTERIRRLVETSGWPSQASLLVEVGRLQGSPVAYRLISPLESDRLLSDFLKLHDATRGNARGQAIARFADQYGFLGRPVIVSVDHTPMPAELLDEWSVEVERLYGLTELLQWLGLSRTDKGHWDHRSAVKYLRSIFGEQPLDQLQLLAERRLHGAINTQLAGEIEAGISPRRRLSWVPSSLIACLYLAFASKVLGGRPRSRVCPNCGRAFEPEVSSKRIYCGDSCRNKAWYAKKEGKRS
jgi:hypothetical protein